MFVVWLAAFPVVGKATLCCHWQAIGIAKTNEAARCPHHQHAASDDTHPNTAQTNPDQGQADACYCGYVQHSQFLASLPLLLSIVPAHSFLPPIVTLNPPAERADLRYRPPIA
ncbi:MAG: hypothetical protein ACK4RS_04720 [Thiothrix sp.]